MKRNLWTAGLTAALSAGILFMQPVKAEAGILPEGFSVAGAGDEALDFSGQTAEEASGKLEEYVGSMAEEEISISIDGTSFSSTAGDLGLYWENEEELNAAIGEYSGGVSSLCKNTERAWQSGFDFSSGNKKYNGRFKMAAGKRNGSSHLKSSFQRNDDFRDLRRLPDAW